MDPAGLLSYRQSIYNLMGRTIELEVLPAARHYGIGLCRGAPWPAGCSPVPRPRKAVAATTVPCSGTPPGNSGSLTT